jgi:hypothetical protein
MEVDDIIQAFGAGGQNFTAGVTETLSVTREAGHAIVLVRIMGLILCSLAVEIVLTALGVGPWTAAPR